MILLLPRGLPAQEASAQAKTIAVIVHKDNPIDKLLHTELARIYKGRLKRWPDGRAIVVLNRPIQSDIRRQFYRQVLGAEPTKRFQPSRSPIPFKMRQIKSAQASRKFVTRIPNAIAYIYLHEADDSVKILRIDGLKPEDEGYRLK